ncbi:MAG: DUF4338 domain-containing protein [Methanomicrobium sp.]|jgi:hypothetical protein|nr:DUF4338 domain-containing protein [Methanomicrobium sp.]
MRYCGREFTCDEINRIKDLIQSGINRTAISRIFCKEVNWRKPDGGLKEMSCRVALLKMHRDGHIVLPLPQRPDNNHRKKPVYTLFTEAKPEVVDAGTITIETTDKETSTLWNEYIDRYHYLGYTSLPGAQLRYIIRSDDQVLALLGFSASAWKAAARDDYIGWDTEARKKNLHLVINNARFLILPWVRTKNLASRILSLTAKRISSDWRIRYGYEPVLLETFVEKERFAGTCYKAANWYYAGDTKGRGKLDTRHEHALPVKSIWLYPLRKDFKKWLKD